MKLAVFRMQTSIATLLAKGEWHHSPFSNCVHVSRIASSSIFHAKMLSAL